MASASGRGHLSIAFCGHAGSGKTTALGRLLCEHGVIGERELQKAQQVSRPGGAFAFVAESDGDARSLGYTVQCGFREWLTPSWHCTIIDVPGQRRFIKNMIRGCSGVDAAVVFVPADELLEPSLAKGTKAAASGQTRQHLRVLHTLGVSQLCIVVSRMDSAPANYSHERFNAVVERVQRCMVAQGWSEEQVQARTPFLPLSGFAGDNIYRKSANMPWWNGNNGLVVLRDVLDRAFSLPCRNVAEPLRMPVHDVYKIKGVGNVVCGAVLQGLAKPGDQVAFLPGHTKADLSTGVVTSIEAYHKPVQVAEAGDVVGMCVKGLDHRRMPRRGSVMVLARDATFCRAAEFCVLVQVAEISHELKLGFSPLGLVACAYCPCRLTKMHWRRGRSTNGKLVENPERLAGGDVALCSFRPRVPFMCEAFERCAALGRVAFLEGFDVVMVGRVERTEEAVNWEEEAPRAVAVPPPVGVWAYQNGRNRYQVAFVDSATLVATPMQVSLKSQAQLRSAVLVRDGQWYVGQVTNSDGQLMGHIRMRRTLEGLLLSNFKRPTGDWGVDKLGQRVNKAGAKPQEGVRLESVSSAELAQLQKLWADRGGAGELQAGWSVDNPLLAWTYAQRRATLRARLERDPHELEAFHGSRQENLLSIISEGFDPLRRSGQAYGAGEYFAKCPEVSRSYCRGGSFMLVCRLMLGTDEGPDADHVWASGPRYYVVSQPSQVLPLYIVQFAPQLQPCAALEEALEEGFDTLTLQQHNALPPQRKCAMTADATALLWIGYLQPTKSDTCLLQLVHAFLETHLGEVGSGAKVQIVRGKFAQAKVRLQKAIPSELVRRLNTLPFSEAGVERTICVDDAHGSTGQKCTRATANYCRGRNLRFVQPCRCDHPELPTRGATYSLLDLDLSSAKADEIVTQFKASMPQATVTAVKAVANEVLLGLHERYRVYLRKKNGREPTVLQLYHGTNNLVLGTLYTHGLRPPSDMKPSDACPVSGGKGLCTSLCDASCEHCTERHVWCRCHMFGLGVYLADLAAKSHRYVSMPTAGVHRMLLCSVLTGSTLQVSGHLRRRDAMHDVESLRALWDGDLADMVELLEADDQSLVASEKQDLLFVPGLKERSRHGFSVYNSEYVAFHAYQTLPRYEISYVLP